MRSETFWEELVVRMADRELNKRHGKAALEAMSEPERKALAEPITKRYWQEFTNQGLDNLHVISRQNAG